MVLNYSTDKWNTVVPRQSDMYGADWGGVGLEKMAFP